MRPELRAEVREWLQRAGDDLAEAEHNLTATPPLIRGAVFHCQQAVEKALKADLTAYEHPFRKTHDLEELGTAAMTHDQSLTELVTRAADLTPYAWRFRYPGTPISPTPQETKQAVALAREVYLAMRDRLQQP